MAFIAPIAAPLALAASALGSGLQIPQGVAGAIAQRHQARTAIQEAKAAEREARRRLTQRYGTARTHFAAAGITLDGSPGEILDDIVEDGEMEALTLRYQGRLRANAARTQSNLSLLGTASQAASLGSSLLSAIPAPAAK